MSQSEDGNSKIGDHTVGVFGYLAWGINYYSRPQWHFDLDTAHDIYHDELNFHNRANVSPVNATCTNSGHTSCRTCFIHQRSRRRQRRLIYQDKARRRTNRS